MKKIVVPLIVFTILFEIISLISSKFNLLIYNNDPDYVYSLGNNWRTEVELWGSWHKKNFSDKHSSKCFNVTYKSNNIGSRDNFDYDIDSNFNSIILLGDSFAEGYAVNFQNTFKNKLEIKLDGKKILNFGSAGHFGPLQAQIIYENLASKYKHDELIYLFFPYNDFRDNDWEFWKKKIRKFRNRPYYIKNQLTQEYEIYYPNKNQNRIILKLKDLIFNDIKNFLLKYTYSANTLRTINHFYGELNVEKKSNKNFSLKKSSYFNENKDAVLGAINSIDNIFQDKNDFKNKILVVIPTLNDIQNIGNKSYKNLLWYSELKNISQKNNIKLIDLADFLTTNDYKKMIHSCDMHWNSIGHSFVADLIFNKFYKKN